jgi:regulatory protein
MGHSAPRRPRPPLDQGKLEELALHYVGRFATSRAKLKSYLSRKLRERGWSGEAEPDLAAIAERFAAQGYIDEAGLALSKAQGLSARGYGKRRLLDTLRRDGIGEAESDGARRHSDREALSSALRFAERRRIGPFAAAAPSDPKQREKAIAAMVRAGHSFALARAIAALAPGSAIDGEELAVTARLIDD